MSRKKKPWVKLDAEEPLRMLKNGWTLADVGVWIALRGLTNMSSTYDINVIAHSHLAGLQGLTDGQLCSMLAINVRQWRRYKTRFSEAKLMELLNNNAIKINTYTNQARPDRRTNMSRKADKYVIPDTDTDTDIERDNQKGRDYLKSIGISGPDKPDASKSDQPKSKDIKPF